MEKIMWWHLQYHIEWSYRFIIQKSENCLIESIYFLIIGGHVGWIILFTYKAADSSGGWALNDKSRRRRIFHWHLIGLNLFFDIFATATFDGSQSWS